MQQNILSSEHTEFLRKDDYPLPNFTHLIFSWTLISPLVQFLLSLWMEVPIILFLIFIFFSEHSQFSL